MCSHCRLLLLIGLIFVFSLTTVSAQVDFEVFIDSSEYRTDLTTDMGHELKFLTNEDNQVVLDYENYRILFYTKGAEFSDNQLLKIVGQHSRVQTSQAFDPVLNNRLSREFTGALYNDMVWISNYSFGELLVFDLNGTHLRSFPGQYRVLDTADTSLYAFQEYSIYRWDAPADTFAYLAELPENVQITSARYGTNVKVGSDRLCVWAEDSLKVYPFEAYINEPEINPLFTDSVTAIPFMDIMNDKIVWATNYGDKYSVADLNGNNRTDTTFAVWTYLIDFCADNHLYLTGSWSLKKYNQDLTQIVHKPRIQYYWDGRFFGGDDQNLYFYDFHDGGFAIAPLDSINGTFIVDPRNEIQYTGWNYDFRLYPPYGLLLSEWPPDSLNIYRFDYEQMTSMHMFVDSAFGFDVVNDTIFAMIGTTLRLHDINGDSLTSFSLSGLSSSNLHQLTRESRVHFAANNAHIFVVYKDTLNIFNHQGEFEYLHRYYIRSDSYPNIQLHADDTYVYNDYELWAINIETGEPGRFVDQQTPRFGFIWGDRYWYESGENIFTYANLNVVTGIEEQAPVVNDFHLFPSYPNPFNPVTQIHYRLGKETQTRLTVFNILGQRIETLVDQKQPAGIYRVDWDAGEFSSGVYFFMLEAESFRATTKAVLLK